MNEIIDFKKYKKAKELREVEKQRARLIKKAIKHSKELLAKELLEREDE